MGKDIPSTLKPFLNLQHNGIQEWLHVAPHGGSRMPDRDECEFGCPRVEICERNRQKDLQMDRSFGFSSCMRRWAIDLCRKCSVKVCGSYAARVGIKVMTIFLTRLSRLDLNLRI